MGVSWNGPSRSYPKALANWLYRKGTVMTDTTIDPAEQPRTQGAGSSADEVAGVPVFEDHDATDDEDVPAEVVPVEDTDPVQLEEGGEATEAPDIFEGDPDLEGVVVTEDDDAA